jgi:hypothetical protein
MTEINFANCRLRIAPPNRDKRVIPKSPPLIG